MWNASIAESGLLSLRKTGTRKRGIGMSLAVLMVLSIEEIGSTSALVIVFIIVWRSG